MLTSRWNQSVHLPRLPDILPKIGDTPQQQPQSQQQHSKETLIRPKSNESTKSIDNAYSLEHLFTALRRRIRRIVQVYNATSFYNALKICARVFQSYASYNLNTIDGFARRLYKNPKDNKKLSTVIDQFRLQLAELRHCHSTFEAELLVTTLALDFHEDELEQQQNRSFPAAIGKFSPRSRFSKFRLQHARQAAELKSQLKQTNEHLLILLFDEFNANLSHLWDESDKYISTSIPFHDHHMTYVLRLIPDVALKFEYALQICAKLFDLEATMSEIYPQNPSNQQSKRSQGVPTELMSIETPRSDFNQSQQDIGEPILYQKLPLQSRSVAAEPVTTSEDITSASTVDSTNKLSNVASSPISFARPPADPADLMDYHEENPIFPTLFSSSENFLTTQNDQTKLQLLTTQLEKRLQEEQMYLAGLLKCFEQTSKKSEEMNNYPKPKLLSLVMSDEPAVTEYQRSLCLSDYQVYKSVEDELDVAVQETQHRIDWLRTVLARARQCLGT